MTSPSGVNKFAIVTSPRSGSELLVAALANHPSLNVVSEVLNPARRHDHGFDGPTSLISNPITGQPTEAFTNPADVIDRAFDRHDGIKLTFDQTTDPAWAALKARFGLRIITIRRNPIDSIISYWYAVTTGIWQREHHYPPLRDSPTVIDLDFAARFLKVVKDGTDRLDGDVLTIDYTGLIRHWDETTAVVQNHLGVVPAKLPRAFRKRLTMPSRDLVLNIDDLRILCSSI